MSTEPDWFEHCAECDRPTACDAGPRCLGPMEPPPGTPDHGLDWFALRTARLAEAAASLDRRTTTALRRVRAAAGAALARSAGRVPPWPALHGPNLRDELAMPDVRPTDMVRRPDGWTAFSWDDGATWLHLSRDGEIDEDVTDQIRAEDFGILGPPAGFRVRTDREGA